MIFDHNHYVPCLRWKQGEYQAVLRLSPPTRRCITPLVEVPEIGWDFELAQEAKSIDGHLDKFAARVREKWGGRRCFVDPKHIADHSRMADGRHPVEFIFAELRRKSCGAVPVTGLDRDKRYQHCMEKIVSRDNRGACVRAYLEQAARESFGPDVGALVAELGIGYGSTDLVLDLGAPNFTPISGFSKVVQAIIAKIPNLNEWRTFTLLATSFPETMGELEIPGALLPRNEWLLYRRVVAGLQERGKRVPTFGDYAVQHPAVWHLDMRLVKPAASIRYSADERWFIIKGPNVRDNGYGQYLKHCKRLVASPHYCGADYSAGDRYIWDCSEGGSTGNLTTWRWVGTNHHLERVPRDVANFFAS
ncbi:MAG: hypothetical protein HN341_14375 [Verrucomicrobia bacterium]|jgi:hypothetical protein|nr:hypothetical protein [Verrucomicrobiota bacterium]